MTVANVVKEFQGVFANDQATGLADTQDLLTDLTWEVGHEVADASAGATATYWAVKCPFNVQIIDVTICPGGSLTADNTNNAVLTLGKSDGAGGAITTVASITTNVASGNWVADTYKSMTLSATFANTLVNDGQLITLKKTVGGTGVVVPISFITIRYRKV